MRAVEIPKPNGGVRILGIPTVLDRLLQQAIQQCLSPVFDPEFSQQSYGFRPARSAHDAVRAAQGYVQAGRKWVTDIDLKAFFDEVNHEILMRLVERKVTDPQLLTLIRRFLRAGLLWPGERKAPARTKGTPQGGPLSPLLANIYLDQMDKELQARGMAFVRYADDIAIYSRSHRSAQRILETVTNWLESKLKLIVNREKSGAGIVDKSSLLGFRITRPGKIAVGAKAMEKLRGRVRELWNARQQSMTTVELRDQWREYIDGWWNYFQLTNQLSELIDLSKWIRRHIRKCFWQRWHGAIGRRKALWRLGIRGRGLQISASGKGAWAMGRSTYVQRALSNVTLDRYGFIIPWELAAEQR